MVNRRNFLKATLAAGLCCGYGTLLSACSGARREARLNNRHPVEGTLNSTTRAILYHASLAPSGHNSQPWRVRIESPDLWTVEIDRRRKLPAVDPDNRELLLSIGAFVENLSIAAGCMGFKADMEVVAGNPNDHTTIQIALSKAKPTGYPLQRIRNRRTVKIGHLPFEIDPADLKTLSQPLGGCFFYFPRGSKHAACIQEATVENFRSQTQREAAQQELICWLRLSNREARLHRDGLSTEGMEIRGLKGWYLRHFANPKDFLKASYRKQGIDMTADLVRQGAGWMIITSPNRTPQALIDTGRRFERMALLARERGIGIHPMTQILEEKQGIEQISAHHSPDTCPQFVLRVGYLNDYPAPVSMRRPVEWFTSHRNNGRSMP